MESINQSRIPKNIPLYQQVVSLIERDIANGTYKIGDQIPTEAELSGQYLVSRTVIREAMKVLKEKGVVETKVATGTFVTCDYSKGVSNLIDVLMLHNLQMDSMNEILEIRKIFEPEVAAIAAKSAKSSEIEILKEALAKMREALAIENFKERAAKMFMEADTQFHMSLLSFTNNKMMNLLLAPFFEKISELQLAHLSIFDTAGEASFIAHEKITISIENRNPNNARKEMKIHISNVQKDFNSLKSIKGNS